jgi:predicted AAA+ superfamily ATPase
MYHDRFADLSYWRLASGTEVDFIVNAMEVAVEAKATTKVTSDHLKGLRELKVDHPEIKKRFLVSLEPKERRTEDGIWVLPYRAFTSRLWRGEVF